MEATPFSKELLERIARIRERRAACPDLQGFELAFDRGNIIADEFDAARAEFDRCQRLIEQETAGIEALAARQVAAFDAFLTESVAQLQRILDSLNRGDSTDTFQQRFARADPGSHRRIGGTPESAASAPRPLLAPVYHRRCPARSWSASAVVIGGGGPYPTWSQQAPGALWRG